MEEAGWAFIGVLVGSFFPLIGNIISNKQALTRDKIAWAREDRNSAEQMKNAMKTKTEDEMLSALSEMIRHRNNLSFFELTYFVKKDESYHNKIAESMEEFNLAVSRFIVLFPELLGDDAFMQVVDNDMPNIVGVRYVTGVATATYRKYASSDAAGRVSG